MFSVSMTEIVEQIVRLGQWIMEYARENDVRYVRDK